MKKTILSVATLWLMTVLCFGNYETPPISTPPAVQNGDYALSTTNLTYFRTESTSQTLFPTGGFTFEIWFRAAHGGVILNEVDQVSESLWDYSLIEVDASGNVIIGLPGIFGTRVLGIIPFNEWQHVVIRYDDAAQTFTGFLNGEKKASLSGIRKRPDQSKRTAFLAFGRNAQNSLAGSGWFAGDMDEIRIWKVPRTDDDILSTWNQSIPTTATDLVMNWHLDEGSGSFIGDASGNNNIGLNVNAQWVVSTLAAFSGPPRVTLDAPLLNTDQSAFLNGSINPNGLESGVHFEYGDSAAYGSVTENELIPAGHEDVPVSAMLTSLTVGEHHFRIVATNSAGTVSSPDSTLIVTNLSGFAVSFDGVNDYIRTTFATRPFFDTKSMTIELWFNADGPGVLVNEVDAFDVSKWDYSLLEILPDHRLVATLPNLPVLQLGTIETGRWYHAAIRYDEAATTFDAFLDGVKVGTTTGIRLAPWEKNSTTYIAFGRGGPVNLGSGRFFQGKMDELSIWRSALSDYTIAQDSQLLLKGDSSDLFALWQFDSVTSDSSPDSSSKNNSALFVNGPVLVASGLTIQPDLRPQVETGNTQEINSLAINLLGAVKDNSLDGVLYFVWGEGNLTNKSDAFAISSNINQTNVSILIQGLVGGQNYHYALVSSNSAGLTYGPEKSFVKIGWAGAAFQLSTNSNYIRTVNDQKPFFVDETITIELWVKADKAGVVFGETDWLNQNLLDNSVIEILKSGTVVAGFPGVPTITLGKIDFGSWNHIALRYNKKDLQLDGFLNGIKVATSNGDRVAPWEINRGDFFTFGKASSNPIGTGESLAGQLDEIRVWSIARNDGDIAAASRLVLTGNEPGLILYWRLDDGNGTLLADASRHNNTGQVSGSPLFVVSSAPPVADFRPIRATADGSVLLQFLAPPNTEIEIESTSDFTTWNLAADSVANSLGIIQVSFEAKDTYLFFRSKQL